MDIYMNTISKNMEHKNYHNSAPIIQANTVSKDQIVIGKTNTEAKEDSFKGTEKENNKETINEFLKGVPGRVRSEYTYHEEVNRISIKVIDEDTQEVIREIPPEKSIEILKQLVEIEGLFVDERR